MKSYIPTLEDTKASPQKDNHDLINQIDTFDNTIYLYDTVNFKSTNDIIKSLNFIDKKIQLMKIQLGVEAEIPINLRIQSYGGYLQSGFAIVDSILRCKNPVYTHIDGYAASAATLISIVGKKRYIGKHATMLIHQLSGGFWGTYREQKDDIQNVELFMKQIKDLYKKYTKIPKKELDDILGHDLYWESTKCLELGLVDQIE